VNSARRSLTEHTSGQSLQLGFSPASRVHRSFAPNLYRSSFVLGVMGQAKLIKRCFPIKQNYRCLWCTPEWQNLNASQTQPGQSVYSRTNCTGSPGQPTRSSGHTRAVPSPGFPDTVGAHTASLLHLKGTGIMGFAQRFSKTSVLFLQTTTVLMRNFSPAAGSHGQPGPSAEAGLLGHNPHPLSLAA